MEECIIIISSGIAQKLDGINQETRWSREALEPVTLPNLRDQSRYEYFLTIVFWQPGYVGSHTKICLPGDPVCTRSFGEEVKKYPAWRCRARLTNSICIWRISFPPRSLCIVSDKATFSRTSSINLGNPSSYGIAIEKTM